jgi:type III pantothenate kinase
VILDIDAGNTRVKWRVVDGVRVIARGDQLTALVRQGEPLKIDSQSAIARIRLSCVAGRDIIEKLQSQFRDQYAVEIELAEVSKSTGSIVCGYRDYSQLGVDRWLAMLAAYAKNPGGVIVVDAGSAATVDVVGADGEHQGGYIVPGLGLMHKALWQGTEGVKVEAKPVEGMDCPGQSTSESVDKGCLLLLVAMIESLADKYAAKLVITGGDAELLRNAFSIEAELYPDLVLDGLAVEGVGLRVLEG